MDSRLKTIQNEINNYKEETGNSVGSLSDTFHTFDELYLHRTVLTALAFMSLPYAWKAKKHEDGSMFDGMFIVGCPTPEGMITYHYDLEHWNLFKIPEIPYAPHFDGHTPNDVIERIKNYIQVSGKKEIGNLYFDKINNIVKNEIFPVFGNDIVACAQFLSFYN